jgi:hypothetical protein
MTDAPNIAFPEDVARPVRALGKPFLHQYSAVRETQFRDR